MNFRNQSIRLSVVLLFVLPCLLAVYIGIHNVFGNVAAFFIMSLFLGYPVIVTLCLAVCSKSPAAQECLNVLLFIYTILFAFFFAFLFLLRPPITLLGIAFFTLPISLPCWVAILVMEIRCRYKKS